MYVYFCVGGLQNCDVCTKVSDTFSISKFVMVKNILTSQYINILGSYASKDYVTSVPLKTNLGAVFQTK